MLTTRGSVRTDPGKDMSIDSAEPVVTSDSEKSEFFGDVIYFGFQTHGNKEVEVRR
jgi:hypothetical protein